MRTSLFRQCLEEVKTEIPNIDTSNMDEASQILSDVNSKLEKIKDQEEESEASDTETGSEDTTDYNGMATEQYNVSTILFTEAREDYYDGNTTSEWFKNQFRTSVAYLKSIGVEYTPIVARRVRKASIVILTSLIKATFYTSKSINRAINRSFNNFDKLSKDIETLKTAIDEIKSKENSFALSANSSNNTKVINNIKIANNVNFVKTAEAYIAFLKDYAEFNINRTKTTIYDTNRLLVSTDKDQLKSPTSFIDKLELKEHLDRVSNLVGYQPNNEFLDTYVYKNVLPGDLLLIGYCPKDDITEPSSLKALLRQSTIFFGINQTSKVDLKEAKYLSLNDLKLLLNNLSKIIEISLEHTKALKEIDNEKIKIKYSIKRLIMTLLDKVNGVLELDDTNITRYMSARIQLIDQCFVVNATDTVELSRRILSSYISFVKENIKAYSVKPLED